MRNNVRSQANPQLTPPALEAVLDAADDGAINFRVILNRGEPFDVIMVAAAPERRPEWFFELLKISPQLCVLLCRDAEGGAQ
jgi:protein-L-isoaspartate O-methyltransferase